MPGMATGSQGSQAEGAHSASRRRSMDGAEAAQLLGARTFPLTALPAYVRTIRHVNLRRRGADLLLAARNSLHQIFVLRYCRHNQDMTSSHVVV
jgi:hypothetical protein